MSHVVCSKIRISDLDILKKVIADKFPKLKFHEGTTEYKWFGRYASDYHQQDAAYFDGIDPKDYGTCAHMISMENVNYQIGVVDRGDGTFTIIWDFYGGDYTNHPVYKTGGHGMPDGMAITNHIGQNAEHLMSAYAHEYAIQFAARNGYMVHESYDDEGNLVLEMTGMQ